ncbi:hypothetical protein B0A55_13772 [Friedmanniomyces simplex]|uniref:Uncharacterized protein n=1 Tax=Friedmanniomyces simplex TaxID=329884 RepID=A0A4U0VWP6_9PEZI|nr:hypothetical protein B0A55_13772 [Friedmanniomyces simplex]
MASAKKRKVSNVSKSRNGKTKPLETPQPIEKQATLPFASPSATPAREVRAGNNVASEEADDEVDEVTASDDTKRITIYGKDRLFFAVDFSRFSAFGTYQLRPRTKRSFGNAPISWIFRHGIEVQELQSNGQYGGRYWLCKVCYDASFDERPLVCTSTSSSIAHLALHDINQNGTIDRAKPTTNTVTNYFTKGAQPEYAEKFQQKLINAMVECDLTFT